MDNFTLLFYKRCVDGVSKLFKTSQVAIKCVERRKEYPLEVQDMASARLALGVHQTKVDSPRGLLGQRGRLLVRYHPP